MGTGLNGEHFPTEPLSNYKEVRETIKTGDLIFCSGNYFASRMISKSSKSPWSHVGIVFRVDAFNRVMVLESIMSKGVRTVPLSKYLSDYDNNGNPYDGGVVLARHDDFSTSVESTEQMKAFTQNAVDMLGYPYDNDEMAKITYRVMKKLMGIETNAELERDKEYICSEYVQECFEKIGICIQEGDAGFIAPSDFARDEKIKLTHVLKRN